MTDAELRNALIRVIGGLGRTEATVDVRNRPWGALPPARHTASDLILDQIERQREEREQRDFANRVVPYGIVPPEVQKKAGEITEVASGERAGGWASLILALVVFGFGMIAGGLLVLVLAR